MPIAHTSHTSHTADQLRTANRARTARTNARARRLGTVLAIGLMCVVSPFVSTMARATDTTTTSVATDTTFVYDLENEPSQCIGFLPKPGCGKKPEQAGDRGGALQWATFGVIIAGVAVIGTVLVRNVIRRDRAIAEDLRNRGL